MFIITRQEINCFKDFRFQSWKSQPKDNLADEELLPLINCILDQPKNWSVKTTTLLLRSKLEANHKRTIERSMMQLQVRIYSEFIVDLFFLFMYVLFFAGFS